VVERELTAPAASAPVASAVPPVRLTPQPVPVASPVRTARTTESAPARANTSKLLLGLALNGSSIHFDEDEGSAESGGGLSAQLGWGFTRNLALVLDASAARIDAYDSDINLAHVDVGARWHFASRTRALVPFLEVALSGRAAGEQDATFYDDVGNPVSQGDLMILGGGVSFGGGLQYFIAPQWALGGTLKWTTGEFNRVRIDNVTVDGFEVDATSARFNLGFTWHPMGGKR
jgi:hypothetical protein